MTEEGELRRQTLTHTNVVPRSVGSKAVHDNGEHVHCRKHRDLLRLQDERALQFIKAFAGQFDQVPARW